MDDDESGRMDIVEETSENLVVAQGSPLNILPPTNPEPIISEENNVDSVPMLTDQAQELKSNNISSSPQAVGAGVGSQSAEEKEVSEDKKASLNDTPHSTTALNASDSFIAMQMADGQGGPTQDRAPGTVPELSQIENV